MYIEAMTRPALFSTLSALCLFASTTNACFGQLQTVSIQDLEVRMANEGKLSLAFFHADWCTICDGMRRTTLSEPRVVEMLNTHFLFLPFDAEQRESIDFAGQTFRYRPNGSTSGMHEWAMELATIDGQIQFPTLTALNAQHEIVFQHQGLLAPDALMVVLEELLAAQRN